MGCKTKGESPPGRPTFYLMRTTSDTHDFNASILEKRKEAVKQQTAEKLGFTDWEHLYWHASNQQLKEAIELLLTTCLKK